MIVHFKACLYHPAYPGLKRKMILMYGNKSELLIWGKCLTFDCLRFFAAEIRSKKNVAGQ